MKSSPKGLRSSPQGKLVSFRLVTETDAQFIVELRTNGKLNRHLSHTAGDVEAQASWISGYKKREANDEEFYFVIESGGADAGLVRLYDFRDGSFCWGSWIIKPGSPAHCGIASALLVYETAFRYLGFSSSHFDVRRENTRVWAFHERMGAKRIGQNDIDFYYTMSPQSYDSAKAKFSRYAP